MKKVFLFLFCMLFALGGNLVFADDGNDKKEIKFEEKTETTQSIQTMQQQSDEIAEI